MKTTSVLGRRACRGLVGLALAATAVPLGASPASAAAINDPPLLPHAIIVFPVRDFVSASGYAATDRPTVEVVRGGVVVGTASGLVPTDDPKTPGFDGLVEVNHPGGGCWESVTPDIRAGDVVRVLTDPGVGDSTPTADVTITQPATKLNAGTVEVKGTAVSATGGRIPVDQLEARIVANQQAFVINGRRTLRASSVGGEGTLAYDSPTSTNWTATFTGLGQVSTVDGVSDADRAVANQTRGMWLGRNPASTAEGTIFEFGEVGGPAAPCTAPLASGPSTPDLTAATDTGASSTDNVTSNTSPSFTGVTGLASATTVNLYVDGVVNGTAPVRAGGAYTLRPATALTDGTHTVSASEVAPSGIETLSNGSLSVTIDTAAPLSPTALATVPGSPGISRAPAVKGTAEAGSTVDVFTDPACTVPVPASGSAAQFSAAGIASPVAADSTTHFFAKATDLAGNASGCSTSSATYVQDSVAPAVPDIAASSTSGLVNVTTALFTFSDIEAGTSFECSRDGAVFAACVSPKSYAGVADGPHTFSVRAVDAAGNTSAAATSSWTVDTVAPTVTINSPTGAVINDTSPTFQFAASEAGSSVVCSLDAAPPVPCTTSGSQTSSALTDGPHTFKVSATDLAGNTGPTATYSFTVDTAVPGVSIDSTPPSPTNDATPSFTFSSPKAGVTFTCAFALASTAAPAFAPCPGGTMAVTSARADGNYKFTVRATDAAGNMGSASTLLTIDTQGPAAPVITARPAASSNVDTPSFGFSSSETSGTFQCTLTPGAAASPCATGETYGPLVDGSYTFKVTVRDAAGNVSPASTVPFKVDTVAPAVTITSGPSGVITSGTAAFGFSSPDAGATFQCALTPTATAFTGCANPKSYTALANGSYTFQVRAADAAGNVGSAVLRSFTVNTAPTGTKPGAPAAPVGTPGVAGGAITASVSWKAPTSGGAPTSYVVKALRISSTGAVLSTTTSAPQPASARSLSMTLPVAANYKFTVTAINSIGKSPSPRSNLVAGR